jgi:hypothetical protein
MPAQRFHHRDARHHRIASTHRGRYLRCSLFQAGGLCRFPNAMQAVESIRLKMAKTGSIASSSFDSGATVALIGNAVGYVGPMIVRPQSALLTSAKGFFQR